MGFKRGLSPHAPDNGLLDFFPQDFALLLEKGGKYETDVVVGSLSAGGNYVPMRDEPGN